MPTTWTPERDALLGTDADGVIALRLGVSRATVAARRKQMDIPPFAPRGRRPK